MPIHKYIVHFDEDIVSEDIVHGPLVLGHGYNLIIAVCDSCRDEFENVHKDSDLRYEGIYQSESYCCHCKSYASDFSKGPRVSRRRFPVEPLIDAVQQVQELKQLVFDLIDN